MILKFTFFFKQSNKNYFLKILQDVAQSCDLKHYDMIVGDELLFFINGSKENLEQFSSLIPRFMPLSLYFVMKSVEAVKEMTKNYADSLNLRASNFDIDLSELLEIKDMNSAHFCDIFEFPKNKFSESVFYKNKEISNKDDLKRALSEIASELIAKKKIVIQTSRGKIALSLKPQDSDLKIMANDIASISLFTRANKHELDALATFEKPSISLKIKDVFISELGFKEAIFILPFDPILSALSSILLSHEIPFIYFESSENDAILDYELFKKEEFFEIILGENGYFINKIFLSQTDEISESSAIISDGFRDLAQGAFISYLSFNHASFFGVLNETPMVNIYFDANPRNALQAISQKPSGKRLVENYQLHFASRIKDINRFGKKEIYTNNILDIFATISVILGFSRELEKYHILKYADDFLRDIGPRIDFKSINIDGKIFYDYLATIQSTMSFALAGVESEVICFGVLDSLADFLINLSREGGVKSLGIMGDLFANKIFFSRITRKISSETILTFPRYLDRLKGINCKM